jgi:hypothetical protein
VEKGLASGIGQQFLGHWQEGPGWPREDAGGRTCCTGKRKPGTNLGQGWVGPDASVWMGGRWRRAGPVGPVRTRVDAMCRPAGDALKEWRNDEDGGMQVGTQLESCMHLRGFRTRTLHCAGKIGIERGRGVGARCLVASVLACTASICV